MTKSKHTNRGAPMDCAKWSSLLMMGLFCISCDANGMIRADARTPECRKELVDSLNTLARIQGFDFKAGPADADSIFKNGEVSKSYARDGVRISAAFALKLTGEGCKLRLYKIKRSSPSEGVNTSHTDHGSIELNACKCNEQP